MTGKAEQEGRKGDGANTLDANNASINAHSSDSTSQPSLKDISDQISNLRTQLTADLTAFKEDVKREVKEELSEFRQQIN